MAKPPKPTLPQGDPNESEVETSVVRQQKRVRITYEFQEVPQDLPERRLALDHGIRDPIDALGITRYWTARINKLLELAEHFTVPAKSHGADLQD
jgi:hypothetical protein